MTAARGDGALDVTSRRARANIAVDVHAHVKEVASARHTVTAFLHEQALPSTVVDDLELVTSELVTNAVVHPKPSGKPVRLNVELGAAVTIEVANYGSVDGIPATEEWRPAEPSELSGRGLGIVRRLCNEVDVRQEGAWAVVVCRREVHDRATQ